MRIAMWVPCASLLLAVPFGCKFATAPRAEETGVKAKADDASFGFADASTLSKTFFQTNTVGVDANAFEDRWKAALEDPLLFFRSFVRAYYVFVLSAPAPGATVTCLGDAHPDNFGFVAFGGRFEYVFNDLDDAGPCPAGWDVMRYFTALRLAGGKGDFDEVLARFLAVLRDPREAVALPDDLVPKEEKVRRKVMEEWVAAGPRLARGNGSFVELEKGAREALAKEVGASLLPAGGRVHDMAEAKDRGGGSRGLTRYWALVEPRPGGAEPVYDIVELKASLPEPATAGGGWGSLPAPRLDSAIKAIWKRTPDLYRTVKWNGQDYVARSRVKDAVDRTELGKKDRRAVLEAQVSLLALHHAGSFADVDALGKWLDGGSKALARRFEEAYDTARGK